MPPRLSPAEPALSPDAITAWLRAWGEGHSAAGEKVFAAVYGELRRRAGRYLRRERRGHTLQPTALVHETYIRLAEQRGAWQSRTHFFAVAATMMRRILVDHARAQAAAKRPQAQVQVELEPGAAVTLPRDVDLVALDTALEELAALDPRQVRIVELRFFGGLPHPEIAAVLGLSLATVNRDWRLARAWLHRRLLTP